MSTLSRFEKVWCISRENLQSEPTPFPTSTFPTSDDHHIVCALRIGAKLICRKRSWPMCRHQERIRRKLPSRGYCNERMTVSGSFATVPEAVAADQEYKGERCAFIQVSNCATKPNLPKNSANSLVCTTNFDASAFKIHSRSHCSSSPLFQLHKDRNAGGIPRSQKKNRP